MSVVRQHRPDEEPDVDERDDDLLWFAEEEHGLGLCERCGHEGHRGSRCPIVTPLLLRT